MALLTVSDTRTEEDDRSGAAARRLLEAAGHSVIAYRILPDEPEPVRTLLRSWLKRDDCDGVIVNGGTGISPRDRTFEAVEVLLDKRLDGFGELFRVLSYDSIGTSTLQSRAIAGVANATYVFVLPGSSGACADAWDKLINKQLDYRTRPCNLVELMPRLLEK